MMFNKVKLDFFLYNSYRVINIYENFVKKSMLLNISVFSIGICFVFVLYLFEKFVIG